MENNNTQYDKRLSEYREKMLQRNKELAEDDDDIIDSIINASEKEEKQEVQEAPKKPVFNEPVKVKPPVSDTYKEYSDKLESVLKEAGVKVPETKETEVKETEAEEAGAKKTETTKAEPKNTEQKERKLAALEDDDFDYDGGYGDYEDDEEDDADAGRRTPGDVFAGVKKGANTISKGLKEYAKDKKEEIVENKKRMPSSLKKWLIADIILIIAFIIVTVCYVSANKSYKYNQMDIRPIDADDLIINDGVAEETEGYTTIALYGVDSRESNLNTGTNSDAIIIVSINNETKEVNLVSVYRDTLLEIQSDSPSTHKVNYAYQLGGSLMSINTLNANLDLKITDYITVDFNAMADVIDALGGVEVTVTEDEINNLNKNLAEQISISGVYSDGIHEAGTQVLNGQQAVAYSRIRSTGQGDITRTERQRYILTALFETASSAGKSEISNLIDVSFDCISTSFTKDEITDLVSDISDYSISGTTGFPFAYEAASLSDKGSVIVPADLSANVSALHEYLYGNASYTPSTVVSEISSEIASETGVSASGDIDISTKTDTTGIEADDSEDDTVTITTPPEGTLEDE